MSFNGMWILCTLVLFAQLSRALGAFGDDISQDNEDNRFAVMGQVTKDIFDVQSGNVTLQLNVQDTTGTMEFWLLDFQEYRFNLDALPVDEVTGNLLKDRTSACSNVYEDADWDTFFNDSYIQDKGDSSLTSKNLFTTIKRGDIDTDGIMRNDKIIFQGDMATFANCKDSNDEEYVWEMTAITSDEIEYRTKLYATNIRPKDPEDPTGGVSFVQSHIELIWRISRSVLAKFLISSTALIKPVLEFARVSAVYDEQNRVVPTQSALHIRFRTIVDANDQMVNYENNSITYLPENVNHALNTIVYQPVGILDEAPACDFVLDEGTRTQMQCQQAWEFKMILDIDTSTQVDNRVPIDASGTFEFLYMAYRCGLENNTLNVSSCIAMSVDPAKISALITIQTTVFVQDEEEDQVIIILHSLTGASNEDLSYGTGSRGVAHKEYVDLRVKFSPAFLRKDYDLFLLLFMVCKGQEYASDQYLQGCLQAPSEDRYVAHYDATFNFIPRITDDNGTVVILNAYNTTHVENDVQQPLHIQEYLREESGETLAIPVHRSTFYNLALSAESDVYTITVVYRLIDTQGRKRRAALPHMQDIILAKSVVGRAGVGRTTGTIITRHARDVVDSVQASHSNRIPFLSLGCPEEATHVQEELDCKCPAGMVYSLNSFNCEALSLNEDVKEVKEDDQVNDLKETAHAQCIACPISLILLANSLLFLLLKDY